MEGGMSNICSLIISKRRKRWERELNNAIKETKNTEKKKRRGGRRKYQREGSKEE